MLWTYARKTALLTLLFAATTAGAAPKVTLSVEAEKEVKVTNEQGKTVIERQAAEDASPGDVIFYTLRYRNAGDETATDVNIDNPLPDGTRYVADSAWGADSEILFSIDGGQTFKKPATLTYSVEIDGEAEQRKAEPEEYSAIRWTIESIPAGAAGEMGFQAQVK